MFCGENVYSRMFEHKKGDFGAILGQNVRDHIIFLLFHNQGFLSPWYINNIFKYLF